ncbi:TonB-dependent receptor [Microbulbifer sp. CAU 1566]|uniref:TonB-dependent receptor n=1 Tax=Microbulbifer sp. CAU 1566 TaxID=2933269 RepID=UPI00200320AD|nr:TonB-dependent receptor [Microbulbifer sp. CAU 1566]MCK7598021.1 TonB-dependent receptor [Microbulbifer sp. CAU 1566]
MPMMKRTTPPPLRTWTLVTSALASAIAAAIPVAAAAQEKLQLEEVVVTAQRREQSMQDIPVAVTAVTGEELAAAQVDSIANIQQISSSARFAVVNSAANSANIVIRGIGTVGNSRAFEGAVGVFVDGVYRTRAGQAMQNWLDMASLEILRGPQGTLFGKNTSAGALILNSNAPDTDAFTLDYEVGVGNYGNQLVRGAANMPLNDDWAMRVAAIWGSEDGYIEDPNGGDYNGREPRGTKVQFLYDPSETFSSRLILDWFQEDNNCCYGQVDAIDGPTQPLINALVQAQGKQLPSENLRDYQQVLSNKTDQSIEDKGAVLQMAWQLDGGRTLKSVSSLRDWRISQQGMDADFVGANILTINESLQTKLFSQEFTLNGDLQQVGPFASADYVVGLYYADEDIDAHHELWWGDQAQFYWDTLFFQLYGYPPGTVDATEGQWSDVDMPADSISYAAFSHWNLDINEQWSLTAGLRYSRDEKNGAMFRNSFTEARNAVFRVLTAQPGPEFDDHYEEDAFSGSLSAQYHYSDRAMAYASYSRGYKSGGVNIDNSGAGTNLNNPEEVPGAIPEDPSYHAEYMDGYELGLKAEYWNGRARSNLALFYNDITDLQLAQFQGTKFTVDNAPEATVYGLELENQFLLNDTFSLMFDLTHLAEARFGDDPVLGFLAERRFAMAPELSANLALDFERPIASGLNLFGRVGMVYNSEIFSNTSNDLKVDAQSEYTANIGVRPDAANWSLSAWCQNCGDNRYASVHFDSPLQAGDYNAYVSYPRTYGLTLRGNF